MFSLFYQYTQWSRIRYNQWYIWSLNLIESTWAYVRDTCSRHAVTTWDVSTCTNYDVLFAIFSSIDKWWLYSGAFLFFYCFYVIVMTQEGNLEHLANITLKVQKRPHMTTNAFISRNLTSINDSWLRINAREKKRKTC